MGVSGCNHFDVNILIFLIYCLQVNRDLYHRRAFVQILKRVFSLNSITVVLPVQY